MTQSRPGAGSSRPQIPKMAELVAAELRREILRGDVTPGESLSSEAGLMERFEISRPTLREALRLLESQQLIVVRRGSHKGPVVRLPDAALTARTFAMLLHLRGSTVADIYQFRMAFEPYAARLAAERASKDEIGELRAVLDAEFDATADFSAFTVVAWRFHSKLVELSGNPAMALIAQTFEQISQRHASAYMASIGDSGEQGSLAYRAHARLVDLLEEGRGEDAEAFWLRHMTVTGEKLMASSDGLSVIGLLD